MKAIEDRCVRFVLGSIMIFVLLVALVRIAPAQVPPNPVRSFEEVETILEQGTHSVTNLGSQINSERGDYAARISIDGTTLFFCRKVRNEKAEQEFENMMGISVASFGKLPQSEQKSRFKNVRSKLGATEFVNFIKRIRTVEGQEDIYVSHLGVDGWMRPTSAGSTLNSEDGHEAPESISADNNLMFLFKGGDIYTSRRYGESWDVPEKLGEPINSSSWDADICFSADGRTLFFASKRDGYTTSVGETEENTDIWVTVKNDSGWNAPVNLGATINTAMEDRSPFLHADGKSMYFASAGHMGQGGMDLFKTTRLNDSSWTEWSKPVNLTNLNSSADDWDLSMPANSEWLYFTSNRVGGFGLYDIYKYRVSQGDSMAPEKSVTLIAGVVKNVKGQPLGAEIRWENLDTGELMGMANSNSVSGEYTIALPAGQRYGYYATKEKYWDTSDNIDLTELSNYKEMQVDIVLNPILSAIPAPPHMESTLSQTSGDDGTPQAKANKLGAGGPIRLTNIFFAFDSAELDSTSDSELNRLAKKLLTHREVRIQIEGHTDDVGTTAYNDTLSQRRADAVREYLITQGVAADRLVATGFGENQPEVDNTSEEGRARNRRVQFREVPVLAGKSDG